MLIAYRELKSVVLVPKNAQQIRCSDIVIDARTGKIAAFLFEDRFVRARDAVMEQRTITCPDNAIVFVSNGSAISDMMNDHVNLIGLPVVTMSGDRIGTIIDIEFDSETLDIVLYLVKPELTRRITEWFRTGGREMTKGKQLLISKSVVIEIKKDKLVIREDVEKQTEHVRLVRARAFGFEPF